MASKKLGQPQHHLWLTYEENRSGGVAIDPSDRWSSYEDEYIDFHLLNCYTESEKVVPWVREQVAVDFDVAVGDTVYVLVVRYETGGTFGRTLGSWYIEGIYPTQEAAAQVLNLINTDTYPGYKPWIGYFEHLEGASYEEMIVE